MRFFIPGATDTADAELMYLQAREQLRRLGRRITDRRICRVKFQQDGRTMNVSVGDSFAIERKPVFAIYEGEYEFLILTSAYGPPPIAAPVQVPFEAVLDVEQFTALRWRSATSIASFWFCLISDNRSTQA